MYDLKNVKKRSMAPDQIRSRKIKKISVIYREVWSFCSCILITGFSFICFEVHLINGLKWMKFVGVESVRNWKNQYCHYLKVRMGNLKWRFEWKVRIFKVNNSEIAFLSSLFCRCLNWFLCRMQTCWFCVEWRMSSTGENWEPFNAFCCSFNDYILQDCYLKRSFAINWKE
jgi:hypothetical protein